jgi:probable rRNA maturation factor
LIDIETEDSAWTDAVADAEVLVLAAAEATLASEGAVGEGVSFLLTDDKSIRDLNRRFRQQDKPTNVLSFPAPQNPERFLGDIALAYGVCAREAAEQGKPLKNHLQHLVAHGVFHLLGYDHETDAQADEMEGLERAVLAGLGIPDPYAAGEGENGRPRPIG